MLKTIISMMLTKRQRVAANSNNRAIWAAE
jgi:hypothetical protein